MFGRLFDYVNDFLNEPWHPKETYFNEPLKMEFKRTVPEEDFQDLTIEDYKSEADTLRSETEELRQLFADMQITDTKRNAYNHQLRVQLARLKKQNQELKAKCKQLSSKGIYRCEPLKKLCK